MISSAISHKDLVLEFKQEMRTRRPRDSVQMRGIRVDLDVIHDSDEFIWVVCHNEVRSRMS